MLNNPDRSRFLRKVPESTYLATEVLGERGMCPFRTLPDPNFQLGWSKTLEQYVDAVYCMSVETVDCDLVVLHTLQEFFCQYDLVEFHFGQVY